MLRSTLGFAGGIKSDILFPTFLKYRLNSSAMFCGCVTVSLFTLMFNLSGMTSSVLFVVNNSFIVFQVTSDWCSVQSDKSFVWQIQ